MMNGGRFISHHLGGQIYFDARHRVIKAKLEGNIFGELVQELELDGTYKDQFLSINGSII
jgi:hypothetical protein